MEILEMNVADLIPYENNPRKNDDAVDKVALSISAFGFKVPIIIDKNNVIVAWHTRHKAAQKLGLTTVPVIRADDLTDDQIKAFRLADNKVADFAEWDFDALEKELDGIEMDLSLFGFADEQEEQQTEVAEDDFDGEPPAETKVKAGDVFQLGDHRLMCGDSTDPDAVASLMGGVTADISITSPPYGAGDSAKLRKHYVRGDEKLESFYESHDDDKEKWLDLIISALANMAQFSKAQFVNIQMLADNKRDLVEIVHENVSHFCDVIIWDKKTAPPQMQKNVLNNQFEFIFVFGNESRAIPFGDFHGSVSNVIVQTTGNNEYADIHKAVFPVQLPAKIMEIAGKAETVLDLFGGTGTTLIACEQLGRKCFMMELDPHYVDVIIQRWESFTGQKAVKLT